MYCVKCGNNNPDGAAFCQNCGFGVVSDNNQNQQKQGNAGNKQGKGGIIGLCAGLGVLITVLVVLIIMVSSGKIGVDNETTQRDGHNTLEPAVTYADNNQGEADSPSQDSNKPVSNAEKPTASSKTLTPSEPSDGISVSENGALYAGVPGYDEVLCTVEPGPSEYYDICPVGNSIFYIDTSDVGIYRCNADGTGHTRIHDAGDYPGNLMSFNNEIYYVGYGNGFGWTMPEADASGHSTYGLHWVNKNGRESRLVESDQLNSFCFYNGEVVFPDGDNLSSTPLTATENFGSNSVFMITREDIDLESVCCIDQYNVYMNINIGYPEFVAYNVYSQDYVTLADGYVDTVKQYGDRIFFLQNSSLYSVNKDGSSKKLISENVDEYVLCNDAVFFTTYSKRDLYRAEFDGTGKKMVVQYMICTTLAADNKKVYFCSRREGESVVYSLTQDCKKLDLVFSTNEGANDISDFLEDGIDYIR